MGDDCGATSPVIPHPPFPHHQPPSLLLLPLGECAPAVAMAASSCEKKKSKKYQKNCILYSVYIRMYKNYFFCLKKKKKYCILNIFPAFKINKSHCSSEFFNFFIFE
jgi:hypothetical protein